MSSARTARPKICVVGSGFRFTSGISYYTHRLATELAADNQVSVILMRRLIPRLLYPGRARVGQTMHGVRYPPQLPVFDGVDWFGLPSLLGAIRLLRRERPDVLVLQWWTGAVLHSYLVLVAVARRLGAQVVIEFHETQDTGEAQLPGAARYFAAVSARLIRVAQAFVVHSQFDQTVVRAQFAIGDRPVYILPHGPFDHHEPEMILDNGPDHSQKSIMSILFFGTIRPYKGLEYLVEAFSGLAPDEAAAMRLQVVGETWEGWHRPLELIAASPHRDRIDVVNRYVTDDELAGFFARADAVALPYTRSSASGPLHIAMSYGLPILLSRVGGLDDGAAGYDGIVWVEPADVDSIGAGLRRLVGLRGQRFADPRSWAEARAVYGAIAAELATGSGPGAPKR